MDRACAGSVFFRRVTPIFLFIRARDLWRNGGHVGHVFLRLRAAQCFRRAFVHAGYAFTQSCTDRSIFFSALDRQRKIDIAIGSRNGDFACAANQTSERHRRRAAPLFRLAKMALEFCEATVALAFRHDYNFAFNCVVLARAPNCREILSASFLRRRRNSDRKSFMVLEERATNRNFELYAGAFDFGDSRLICGTAWEIYAHPSLLAGCNGSLHHCRGLWESSSVVSTSTRADRRCLCWRSLRIYRIENPFAHRSHYIFDLACEFFLGSCLSLCATPLSLVLRGASRCWVRIKKAHSSRCINHRCRQRRSDH